MTTPSLDRPPTTDCGCDEGRRLEFTRRGMFKMFGGAAVLTTAFGAANLAFGAAGTKQNVLVTVVLAGGNDGLSVVPPLGDPAYAAARPSLAVPAGQAKQLDSRFGLHPALSALYPMWQAGTFAAIQAVGQESPTRSHFEAMEELERAAPTSSERSGWLNRTLGLLPDSGALEAVSLGSPGVPGHLRGTHPSLSAGSLDEVELPVNLDVTPLASWTQAVAQLHTGASSEVSGPMHSALDAVATVSQKVSTDGDAKPPASYPDNSFGKGLWDVARLIKADSGLRVASVQLGGWDTHVNHGNVGSGVFAPNLKTLGDGLAAFFADLGPEAGRTTVITLTEFGRRVKENGNGGLDHGHGWCMLALGGGVNGGKVHGTWPGLAAAELDLGLDLKATTDYRSVIAELLTSRMGASNLSSVFPGFSPRPVGVFRAG